MSCWSTGVASVASAKPLVVALGIIRPVAFGSARPQNDRSTLPRLFRPQLLGCSSWYLGSCKAGPRPRTPSFLPSSALDAYMGGFSAVSGKFWGRNLAVCSHAGCAAAPTRDEASRDLYSDIQESVADSTLLVGSQCPKLLRDWESALQVGSVPLVLDVVV